MRNFYEKRFVRETVCVRNMTQISMRLVVIKSSMTCHLNHQVMFLNVDASKILFFTGKKSRKIVAILKQIR